MVALELGSVPRSNEVHALKTGSVRVSGGFWTEAPNLVYAREKLEWNTELHARFLPCGFNPELFSCIQLRYL
jgi:hypothetical protein